MRTLPELVIKLTHAHDAWIVGGAADPNKEEIRDYDVQVPFSEWGKACMLIPKDATRNTLGGFKCISEGIEVDVWAGELGWIMQKPMCEWAYHPASGIRIKTINNE